MRDPSTPVVHLELHTGDLARAQAMYAQLCGWRAERIEAPCGSYTALELGRGLGGGIVECETRRPLWLPYVEVTGIGEATERAAPLEAGQAAPGAEHRFLEGVLGVLDRSQHPVAVGVELAPVGLDDPLEGALVASACGFDQPLLPRRTHHLHPRPPISLRPGAGHRDRT